MALGAVPLVAHEILMPEELQDIAESAKHPLNQKKLKKQAEKHISASAVIRAETSPSGHREKEAARGNQLDP